MGVKKNIGFNLILTFCNYLIPLIVYPYISRVLEVNNVGSCNFIDSVINDFLLISMAGISSYGVREIARCKHDQQKLQTKFSSLIALNFILTVIALIILVICIYSVNEFTPYRKFLWVGVFKIIFNVFLIEWFYQGI